MAEWLRCSLAKRMAWVQILVKTNVFILTFRMRKTGRTRKNLHDLRKSLSSCLSFMLCYFDMCFDFARLCQISWVFNLKACLKDGWTKEESIKLKEVPSKWINYLLDSFNPWTESAKHFCFCFLSFPWPVRRLCHRLQRYFGFGFGFGLHRWTNLGWAKRSEAKVISSMQTKAKAKAKCAVVRGVGINYYKFSLVRQKIFSENSLVDKIKILCTVFHLRYYELRS